MIIEYKSLELYEQKLFSWAILKTPVRISGQLTSNEACFEYVIEGENQLFSEKEKLTAHSHEAILSKCGNYITKLKSKNSPALYNTITVHFHEEVLRKIYKDSIPEFLKKKQSTDFTNMVKVEVSGLISQYIENIRYYFNNPQLVSEDILILKLKEIILLLLQTKNAPQIHDIINNLFSRRAYSFKEVIDAHICSDISLTELAHLTNHSLSSFKREFKRIYSNTPANYILNKRIEKVADLLLVSDEPITHIAYDCGFKSIAHLSRLFKEKYEISPSDFRQKLIDQK